MLDNNFYRAPVAQQIEPFDTSSVAGQASDFELDSKTENPFHRGEPALIPAGEAEGSFLSIDGTEIGQARAKILIFPP